MPAEDGGGRNFDRQALQATLADLVKAADETAGDPGPVPAAGTVEQPAAPAPRPRIPTVRAPGQTVPVSQDTPPAAPRPQAAPQGMPPGMQPGQQPPAAAMPSPRPSQAPAQETEPAPVPLPDGVRPPTSGRPRLPFSPNPKPSPQGGPVGTVRPGSGGMGTPPAGGVMGSGVRAPSFSGGLVGGLGGISNSEDDVVMPGRSLNPSSGLAGIGRMSGSQGDNLARLAPTPTEQPTIPLRRRKPENPAPAEAEAPAAKAGGPGGAPQPEKQAPRPQVAIEPWVPSYDDILPQRSASGKSFRLRRR